MRLALVAWMLLFVVSCSTKEAKAVSGDAAFSTFVDEYFNSYFDFHPSQGTSAGLHKYDAKLENFSATRIQERLQDLRALSGRLDLLRKEKLSPDNAIDASVLDGQIRSEIQEIDVIRSWRKNPIPYLEVAGSAIDGLMKRNFAPAKDRLRLVIERMQQTRALLDALQNNISEPPIEFTTLASNMATGSIGYFKDTVAEWARQAAGNDDNLFSNFRSVNRTVIGDLQVVEAFLKGDIRLLSKGSYAIGSEAFVNKLRYEEMVDIPLDRVLAIGEANLQKDYDALLATAKRIAPGKAPAEVMKTLSNDHPTEKELIPSAKANLDRIRLFLVANHIIQLPSEVRPAVVETPPFLRSGVFASMDTPGAYEKKATEAFYYVTPPETNWTADHKEEHLRLFNRPVMDIITIHEAFPGHFTQFLYSNQFPTKTRKLVLASSNAEGWAHYAEQMMLEEGFGNGDPKLKLAQLSEALLRDCRYVVGIKLHTQGMSVEDGAKIFVEKGFQEKANAYEEARRGAYDPTYLYYTLGKLQIYKLREDYKKQKGSAYSLEQFHGAFVSQGALPVLMVRKILLGDNNGPTL